jgi:serine O-acetyltransferase
VVIHPVPDHSTVVGVPGRVVRIHDDAPGAVLEHGRLPDPEGDRIQELTNRVADLESRIKTLAASYDRELTLAAK